MRYDYPVFYAPDTLTPGIMVARIPGLDGTNEGPSTCGDNLEDARIMASGLIDAWVCTWILDEGQEPPAPGPLPEGEGWELAQPSLSVLFALRLRELRAQAGWTQAEAAARLGIKQPQYARLEDPDKANPTLSTLERLSRVFKVSFLDLSGFQEGQRKRVS